MKVSVDWLQTFFDTPLPSPAKIENALTFHSSEIDEVTEVAGDTVLEVKVLPDKSAWMLSHRGVARELSVILGIPLSNDPLARSRERKPESSMLQVALDTDRCQRYCGALIRGVKVGPSPSWLQGRLAAIGQRSINNIVDATNYVMFHMGQPLHAFDAGKLKHADGKYEIGVRMAHTGESITTLTDDTYTLSSEDIVITDRADDTPIGIGGVKGGAHARVDAGTTDIIIEAGNFDRVSVRKTAQRLRIRTDASSRYENGVVPELAGYGLEEAVKLITELAGGQLEGSVDVYPNPTSPAPVTVSVAKINSVLGLSLKKDEIDAVFEKFGYERTWLDDAVTITPPFERDDLLITEDLIEEVGRMHGLSHITAVTPLPIPLLEFNTSFHYAEQVREILLGLGFSEVFTSSFSMKDTVKLANALATDKAYLRSSLSGNLIDALLRNVPNKDLLALPYVAIFEIGTVFEADNEHVSLAFGVRHGTSYNAKKDDPILEAGMEKLKEVLGFESFSVKDGVAEVNFTDAIADLPAASAYAPFVQTPAVTYKPFSPYPYISRDIALWVPEGTSADEVIAVLDMNAGALRVKTTLFDEFQKDGQKSYAFRLIFQSDERTLTDEEIQVHMERVYGAVSDLNWTVR